MDVKKMLQNGFEKVTVALLVGKDRNGESHITVVDTPEHAKEYKAGEEMRLATMYRLPPESSATSEVEKWKAINERLYKEMSERIVEERKIAEKYAIKRLFEEIDLIHKKVFVDFAKELNLGDLEKIVLYEYFKLINGCTRTLKEKYAKGQDVLGECTFSETIDSEPLDLCDVKFVTPDGNEVPSNYEAWESLPPLTIAGELSDEDKAKFLDDLSKGCLNLGFLFQKLRVTNVREENKDKPDITSCGNSAEWTQCNECIYFEDCQTKEDRDGCYFGEGGE